MRLLLYFSCFRAAARYERSFELCVVWVHAEPRLSMAWADHAQNVRDYLGRNECCMLHSIPNTCLSETGHEYKLKDEQQRDTLLTHKFAILSTGQRVQWICVCEQLKGHDIAPQLKPQSVPLCFPSSHSTNLVGTASLWTRRLWPKLRDKEASTFDLADIMTTFWNQPSYNHLAKTRMVAWKETDIWIVRQRHSRAPGIVSCFAEWKQQPGRA